MSASVAESTEADQNQPTGAPQVSNVVQGVGASQDSTNPVQVSTPVPTNVFMGKLQVALDFTTAHIKFLVKEGYDTQESELYWKCIDIK